MNWTVTAAMDFLMAKERLNSDGVDIRAVPYVFAFEWIACDLLGMEYR